MNLKFIVKEIENNKVLLTDESGENFLWPKFKLPPNISVGQELYFYIDKKEISPATPQEILKEILEIN